MGGWGGVCVNERDWRRLPAVLFNVPVDYNYYRYNTMCKRVRPVENRQIYLAHRPLTVGKGGFEGIAAFGRSVQ